MHSARAALDHSSDFADIQRHAVERRAEHHHLPAVPKGVGYNLAKVTDVDAHALDWTTGGSLVGDLGDRRADSRVRAQRESLETMWSIDRLDKDANGI